MASLVRVQGSLLLSGDDKPGGAQATIKQILTGGEGPSFYDPGLDPELDRGVATGSRLADAISSNAAASPLRHATSLDIRFTPVPIPESVFFIYKATGSGRVQYRVPIATAFVLNVPDVRHHTLTRFLVTARHVLDPEWAHCSNPNPSSVELRLNRRSGGVGYETISLHDAHARHYFTPADGTSDIAILRLDERLIPDLDAYKFVDIPFQLIPSEADLRAVPATQQVITASRETQVQPDLSAFPITGRGTLSSTSNEPVDTHCGSNEIARPLHTWLIDGAVQQGFSGAPVYTSLMLDGEATPTTILLGIQAFAWPERGVAGITPSPVLADLIESALLSRNREGDLSRNSRSISIATRHPEIHSILSEVGRGIRPWHNSKRLSVFALQGRLR